MSDTEAAGSHIGDAGDDNANAVAVPFDLVPPVRTARRLRDECRNARFD